MTPQWIRLKQLAMGGRYPTKAEYFESVRPAIIALLADVEAQPLPPSPGESPAPEPDALAELERAFSDAKKLARRYDWFGIERPDLLVVLLERLLESVAVAKKAFAEIQVTDRGMTKAQRLSPHLKRRVCGDYL